jgi:hypothetical protein
MASGQSAGDVDAGMLTVGLKLTHDGGVATIRDGELLESSAVLDGREITLNGYEPAAGEVLLGPRALGERRRAYKRCRETRSRRSALSVLDVRSAPEWGKVSYVWSDGMLHQKQESDDQ